MFYDFPTENNNFISGGAPLRKITVVFFVGDHHNLDRDFMGRHCNKKRWSIHSLLYPKFKKKSFCDLLALF